MKASEVDITYEMRNGYSPYRGKNYESKSSKSTAATVLVHGFCAPYPPFPSEQFTNPVVFKHLWESHTIHDFARLIISLTAEPWPPEVQYCGSLARRNGCSAHVHLL